MSKTSNMSKITGYSTIKYVKITDYLTIKYVNITDNSTITSLSHLTIRSLFVSSLISYTGSFARQVNIVC